jgi:hypothetical protein
VLRIAALLLLAKSAIAAPVWLVVEGSCPDAEMLRPAIAERLSSVEITSEPVSGARAVVVSDLGDEWRVVVDGVARKIADPARDCTARVAAAAVLLVLALEPPRVVVPPPQPSLPPPVIAPAVAVPSPRLPRLELELFLGGGIGYVEGGTTTDVAWQGTAMLRGLGYVPQPVLTSGVAFQPLHYGVGIYARVSEPISLGVRLRIGHTLINNADAAAAHQLPDFATRPTTDAVALFRMRVAFVRGRVHPFVSFGIGGGVLRHNIDLSSASAPDGSDPLVDRYTAAAYTVVPPAGSPINRVCPTPTNCIDTVSMGNFFMTLSSGVYFDVARGKKSLLRVVLEVEMQGAVPTLGANCDFRLGIEPAFL